MKKKKFKGLFYINGSIVFTLKFSAQDTKSAWTKFGQSLADKFTGMDFSEIETMQIKVSEI